MKPEIGDTVQFKKSGITGTVEKILRGACVVKTPVSRLSAWPEDLIIVGLSEVSLDKEMEEYLRMCDEIMDIQGIAPIEAEIEEAKTYWDSIKDAWICPEGYIFKDENGNVINATKIVLEKKKKEYPKTYEECCEVLGYDDGETYCVCHTYANERLFESLYRLKVCRDAYWKIAGEEMGLGKPWEPDWNNISDKYCIYFVSGNAWSKECQTRQCPFAFPTPEMRDAFKENFYPDIEFCKELL